MPLSGKKPVGLSIATVFALCIFTAAASLWAYHNHVLRPWEAVSVDFRRLSDAKLGQLAERAMVGQSTSVTELETFIQELQANIHAASKGRLVFTSGAVLNTGVRDLTEEIALQMGLDLSKGLKSSLPGMADRIGGTLSRNLDAASPDAARNR